MNKNALIVFAKNPELGKVKTRLAKDVGNEQALQIYLKLLQHTYLQTKDFPCKKFLFLSKRFDENLFDKTYSQLIQKGLDLGEKMKNSFAEIFDKGFGKAIIIGTDCFKLDEKILRIAFEMLSSFDFVIGPSFDGGYYLLGMNKRSDYLFENIEWSTDNVLSETIKKIEKRNFTYYLTCPLHDVDTLEDLSSL